MMATLFYREVIRPSVYRSDSVSRTTPAGPREFWLGVYSGAHRSGFVNVRTKPLKEVDRPGAEMRLLVKLRFALFGKEADLGIVGNAWRADDNGFTRFEVTLRSAEQAFNAEGTFDAGVLAGNVLVGGESVPFRFDLGPRFVLGQGLGLGTSGFPDLKPGEEVYVDAFDPISMAPSRAHLVCTGTENLEIGGRQIQTRVLTATIGAIKTTAWIDDRLELVKATTPFGFSIQRISAQEALDPLSDGEGADIIRGLAVPAGGIPLDRDVARLRLRFGGVDEASMPPADRFQSRDGDLYTITQPAAPSGDGAPLSEEERQKNLAADAMVNAASQPIIDKATEIVGEVTDNWEKALRIHDFVFENIEKKSVLSVPSALEVLRTRQGDCNEHTVLFVALARAAGVPARIAIGFVYSEEIGGFGYHAWPEVYAGGWIPMDPTLGQELADATHVKLLNGGIEEWARLIPYIGNAQIEVLEAQ